MAFFIPTFAVTSYRILFYIEGTLTAGLYAFLYAYLMRLSL